MPFDTTPQAPSLTPWTTADELTAEQDARFGDSVRSKDAVRARCDATRQSREAAQRALKATGGDKLSALALMLNGSRGIG